MKPSEYEKLTGKAPTRLRMRQLIRKMRKDQSETSITPNSLTILEWKEFRLLLIHFGLGFTPPPENMKKIMRNISEKVEKGRARKKH